MVAEQRNIIGMMIPSYVLTTLPELLCGTKCIAQGDPFTAHINEAKKREYMFTLVLILGY